MKKKLLFGLCCIALIGCTTDIDDMNNAVIEGAPQIKISGHIDQDYVSRVNDEGFCNNDAIGIYVVNYENGVPGTLLENGNQANNVRYVFNEKEYKWTPDYPVYYRDNITSVNMIGYYPYNGALENVNNYTFEVQQDQSATIETSLMGGYEASDFLWGKVENVQPTDERIHIVFNHKMAGVQVELTEGIGWSEGEWASVEKHALIANTIRKASIDLATGIVTPIGEREITDIVPVVNGQYYRAIVVPQTIDASMALFRITVDGIPYLFRKSEVFEYQAGKLHKFTISVSKKELSGVEFELVSEEISPWESETISHDGTAREYVIINVHEASTDGTSALQKAIEKAGMNYERIANIKIIGKLNQFDFYFMRDNMLSLAYANIEDVELCDEWNEINNVLPAYAFAEKSLLRGVILPLSIEEIGRDAFESTGIRTIYLPNSLRKLGRSAFQCCPLESVNIPTSLEEIGSRVFCADDYGHVRSSLKFTNFHLPNSLRKIDEDAFLSVSLNCELVLPDGIEEIGAGAFSGCKLIGNLRIPDHIKEIQPGTFSGNNFSGNLELPSGLIVVGNAAFLGSGFTGELILPDGIVDIGSQAFEANNFSGSLQLPESLISIGSSAFSSNKFSRTLILPSSIAHINLSAFSYNNFSELIIPSNMRKIEGVIRSNFLKTVVCKSKTPPQMSEFSFVNSSIQGSTEQAVRMVNVQVPEEALYKYQTAAYWSDYIPSVYRDFNIDIEQVNALNAKFSKKTIVRAPSEMEWSIIHKPDWVTVTPSSGLGKVEVIITIDEMAQGIGNRADSLVFKPTAYDHYKVIKVNQYDYEYGNGNVITNQIATKGNGVNIVFMGDCFDAKDIAEGYYEEIMNEAIEHFFAVEPYTTYRNYFNVYTIIGHSTDSGMPTTYTMNQESLFESQYAYGDDGFYFKINKEKCLEYACLAPTVNKDNLTQTPVVVIENSDAYGGVTYLWEDNSALSVQCIMRNEYPFDFRGVIQHEVGGHAFGKLGDEYIYHGDFIDMCPCKDGCPHDKEFLRYQNLGWYQNLSLNASHYEVPWSHLIYDPQFQMYVDMYEGGFMHQRGVYRSEINSCMNNNIPYYSAISREAIVKRIMEYAGEEYSFETFKANDVNTLGPVPMSLTRSSADVNFTPDPMHNEPVIMGEKPVLNF